MKSPSNTKPTWSKIAGVSAVALVVAMGFSLLWQAWAIDLLFSLYVFGAAAGWFARRQGWLCGIIVGLPVAFFQLSRLASHDHSSLSGLFADPDYWRLVVPASIAATGIAIMGGMTGAWMQDAHFQRRSKLTQGRPS
jgi:hypothetical protein